MHAALALTIVDPPSHYALCYALNILAHTILISALRVLLFLREGHVCLTLLHPSWLIHEPVFCWWLAVWVQSHPRSCHTKQLQRSHHVYLSESGCPVLRVSHHLSLLSVRSLSAVMGPSWPILIETAPQADPSKAPCGYLMSLWMVLLWFLIGTSKRLEVDVGPLCWDKSLEVVIE